MHCFAITATCILLMCSALRGEAQTRLQGTILSTNGKTISDVVITAERTDPSDIFSEEAEARYSPDGSYSMQFDAPGIYMVTIRAVFHRTLRLPILIYDQDVIEADLYILPAAYNRGTYFKNPEYLEWIRVYGDFNGYDFFNGIPFRLNDDGSITATIPAEKNTIRYQIKGLGASVLPGAHDYHLREDGSFEAILIKPEGSDVFEITYDPSEEMIYSRSPIPENIPFRINRSHYIRFGNPNDLYWIEPLKLLRNAFYSTFTVIETPDDIPPDILTEKESININVAEEFPWLHQIEDQMRNIESTLRNKPLHEQQISAFLIGYTGLLTQIKLWTEMMNTVNPQQTESLGEDPVSPDKELLKWILNEVSPIHPLWGSGRSAATSLIESFEFDPEAIRYAEEMAQHHASDDVVRTMSLFLIRHRAPEFDRVEEMPYYQWIIERYGDNNLAQRARLVFQEQRGESEH